jgi:hypothetical protein
VCPAVVNVQAISLVAGPIPAIEAEWLGRWRKRLVALHSAGLAITAWHDLQQQSHNAHPGGMQQMSWCLWLCQLHRQPLPS